MWPDKKPVNTVLFVRRYKHRKKLSYNLRNFRYNYGYRNFSQN